MAELVEASREDTSRKVARAVCGALLIWTGAALLLRWSWGVGLLGGGVVLLAAQAVRALLKLKLDGFGVVAGALLAICGVWALLEVSLDLVPMLLIVAGVAVLVSSWSSRRPRHVPDEEGHLQPPAPRA